MFVSAHLTHQRIPLNETIHGTLKDVGRHSKPSTWRRSLLGRAAIVPLQATAMCVVLIPASPVVFMIGIMRLAYLLHGCFRHDVTERERTIVGIDSDFSRLPKNFLQMPVSEREQLQPWLREADAMESF